MAATPEVEVTLDGRLASIDDVVRNHCHDVEYPIIRCFRKAIDRDASIDLDVADIGLMGSVAVTAGVVYVTVYESTNFAGASFSISQNYDALAAIGWNDRISSFKGRNSESGRFFVDWFGGGSYWPFCCNSTYGSLGTYDNTFSSVYRT